MGQKGKRERVEQNGEERGEMREEREKGESRAKGERERVGWVRVSGAREWGERGLGVIGIRE